MAIELFKGSRTTYQLMDLWGLDYKALDCEPEKLDLLDLVTTTGRPELVIATPPSRIFTPSKEIVQWRVEKRVYPGGEYDRALAAATGEAAVALGRMFHTMRVIARLKPLSFIVVAPRGLMRLCPALVGRSYQTVTLCNYGYPWRAPTDIWTNLDTWRPKPPCTVMQGCHEPGAGPGWPGLNEELLEELLVAFDRYSSRHWHEWFSIVNERGNPSTVAEQTKSQMRLDTFTRA